MNLEINFLELLKTSFTLSLLAAASVVFLAFTLERWFFFRKIRLNVPRFWESLRSLLEKGRFEEALNLCEKSGGPVASVAKAAIGSRSLSREQIEELVLAVRLEERHKLENYLGILGTLGNTAPFIGLFGTVVGIIKAFRDLALSGSGGPSVVAAGIAEALVATAGGLAVATPSVIFYNYFLRRVKTCSVAMETTQKRVLAFLGGK